MNMSGEMMINVFICIVIGIISRIILGLTGASEVTTIWLVGVATGGIQLTVLVGEFPVL